MPNETEEQYELGLQFETILEARKNLNVKRLHTQPHIVPETVGHHSAGVAILVMTIDPDCSAKLLKAAILHDMGEYHTGDIPATAKWYNRALASAEGIAADSYCKQYGLKCPELTDREYWLLKLCDGLDLLLKCREEVDIGNRSILVVLHNIRNFLHQHLMKRECPLATYILERRHVSE